MWAALPSLPCDLYSSSGPCSAPSLPCPRAGLASQATSLRPLLSRVCRRIRVLVHACEEIGVGGLFMYFVLSCFFQLLEEIEPADE